MSIELKREKIGVTRDNCASNIRAILDSDVIVPDTKPDAVKVLGVDASALIGDKYISKDYITITGTINYKILYVGDGENKSAQSIDYSSPFSQQIDAKGADESMTCFVKCKVGHVEHSIKNSRKINIKSAIDIDSRAYDMSEVALISEVDGDIALPRKEKCVNNFNLKICQENSFEINETVSLPETNPKADEILKCSVKIKNDELKVVLNKVVVKGNISLTALYKSDDNIYTTESEIPYTEILNVDSVTPEMYTVAEYDVKDLSFAEKRDDEGKIDSLDVGVNVYATIMSYEEKKISYISDIYCPDYELEVSKESMEVCELVDAVSGQCVVNDNITFADSYDIEKIYSLSSSAHIDSSRVVNNSVVVNGTAHVCLMGKLMSDEPVISSAEKEIPFTYSMPVSREVNQSIGAAETDAVLEHQSFNIDGSGNVSLRLVIKLHSLVTENHKIDAVSDITYDENNKTDKSNQSGITVYFVQNNDDIWDIAKRYHTTEEEILSVNRLENSILLTAGQQLIIPKRGGR